MGFSNNLIFSQYTKNIIRFRAYKYFNHNTFRFFLMIFQSQWYFFLTHPVWVQFWVQIWKMDGSILIFPAPHPYQSWVPPSPGGKYEHHCDFRYIHTAFFNIAFAVHFGGTGTDLEEKCAWLTIQEKGSKLDYEGNYIVPQTETLISL